MDTTVKAQSCARPSRRGSAVTSPAITSRTRACAVRKASLLTLCPGPYPRYVTGEMTSLSIKLWLLARRVLHAQVVDPEVAYGWPRPPIDEPVQGIQSGDDATH